MKPLAIKQKGAFRQSRGTRRWLGCNSPPALAYPLKRFPWLAHGAEAALRDQGTYFAHRGSRGVGLKGFQIKTVDGQRLKPLNPSRPWGSAHQRPLRSPPIQTRAHRAEPLDALTGPSGSGRRRQRGTAR
jgi:hypothetical protein